MGKQLTFDAAFERVIGHEAGYTAGKGDPGGETKYGISKRQYPHLDIQNLTLEQAKQIYLADYWEKIPVELPAYIKFQVFDFAVNSGMETAIRKLQQALAVADDGYWGPISTAALASTDKQDLLMLYIAIRLEFMTSLSIWPTFGRGWARRQATNLRYAVEDN